MKKWLWMLPLVILFALLGCSVPGNVYLSFDWSIKPYNWNSTDPNIDTPIVSDTLRPQHYYLTEPGDYYFEYTHDNLHWYNIYYTLTAHEGFASPGEDAYFLIYLNVGAYPVFWQIQGLGAASTTGNPDSASPAAGPAVQSGSSFDKSAYEYRQLSEFSETQGRFTLTVRTGVWTPRQ
jgi:hypothetical protein